MAWVGALLVPALLLTGPLVAAPKDKDKDIDKTDAKMYKAGKIVGKILTVIESKKSLRLQVTVVNPKLNQGAYNGLIQAQRSLQQALARRPIDINAIRSAQQQIAQHKANLYTYEKKTQDIELKSIDDVVVRKIKEPQVFDDKGKIKKLTPKEKKELKGDPKLPGYKAEFSDLAEGQLVECHLVKKKDAPKVPIKPRKGADKDADLDLLAETLPQVQMIVVLKEEAPPK
jgi:hypothetical protein